MKKVISLICVFAAAFLFCACFKNSVDLKIEFIVDGEVYATASTDRESIKMPADPTPEGYVFEGWFWDEDVWEKPFTLNSIMEAPLSEVFKVYAKLGKATASGIIETEVDMVDCSRFYYLVSRSWIGYPIVLSYPDANAVFECSATEGSFSYNEELKTLSVKSGDGFYWSAGATEIDDAYIDILLKSDENIIGYAVIKIIPHDDLGFAYSASLIKSAIFPKSGEKFQDVSLEQVKTLIQQAKSKYKEAQETLSGVSLKTRQEFYGRSVQYVAVTWSNETPNAITYFDEFRLERLFGEKWCAVQYEKTPVFSDNSYLLAPDITENKAQHSYAISQFTDDLREGQYRIAAKFSSQGKNYRAYAEFSVVNTVAYGVSAGSISFLNSNCFKLIGSLSELKKMGVQYDESYYTESFFAQKSIIMLAFVTPNQGNELKSLQIQKHGEKLVVQMDFHDGMLTALGHFGTAMAVDKAEVAGITSIELKKECNCAPEPVERICVILTPEATLAAYEAGKTYNILDFPEYKFFVVENLFTMKPHSPDFKRILYLHFNQAVYPNDTGLQKAIELIAKRPDVYYAGV